MAPSSTGAGPRILGLTGPIGCGKTTVGSLLLELGAAERIDADGVVHELMQPGTPTTAVIVDAFGTEMLAADGGIDRVKLGQRVFSDRDALRRLEGITHPAVRREIRARLTRYRDTDRIVVVDAVKLLQSELLALADAVWVVTCGRDVQIHRLTELRGMTKPEAEARLAAMPSFEHPRVTVVIDNSGSLEDLRTQVEQAWRTFTHTETP